MIIRRKTVLHINLGNYEWVELHAEGEVEEEKLTRSGIDYLQESLDRSLEQDILEAREVTGLTPDKSFIFHWKQEPPS